MFTRTLIDRAAIDELANRPGEAKLFFASLRDVATLLLNSGDLDYLQERLPFAVWQRLKDDLLHKSVLWRPRDHHVKSNTRENQPEVLVSYGPESQTPPPVVTAPPDYPDCAPVHRRVSLGRGTETARSRDEFFTELLLPALDAQKPSNRRVSIYDAYLFQDVQRSLDALRHGRQLDKIDSMGLVWLLRAISGAYSDHASKPRVSVYTAESDADDYLDVDAIQDIAREVLGLTGPLNIELKVNAIGSYNKKILHLRGIYVNETRGFVLDRGISDFNLPPASTLSSNVTLATKYHPQIRLSPETARELQGIRSVALKTVTL